MGKKLNAFFLFIGICFILCGAFGIQNPYQFKKYFIYIAYGVLFFMGTAHIFYLFGCRKSIYFHWKLFLFEGILEYISIAIIYFLPKKYDLIPIYLSLFMIFKGITFIISRQLSLSSWENFVSKSRIWVIFKGLVTLTLGIGIATISILNNGTYLIYSLLGWYFTLLGIHYITFPHTIISKEEFSTQLPTTEKE